MLRKVFHAIALLSFAGYAQAALITEGFTFAVASASGNTTSGTRFHSNTGGAFGNPAGKAEVGRYFTEEVRGLSEYDLAGLVNSVSAFVTFNVFDDAGLFPGENDFPFDGTIVVEAYSGNNTEDLSDYEAATVAPVGSFVVDNTVNVGDIFSFDITTIFNDAIDNSLSSLGIRLRAEPLNTNGGAWTFDTFRLTTDDQASTVPAPMTLVLVVVDLAVSSQAKNVVDS